MGVIVAIDGPAGAGKSTVARSVAERLGFGRVDTGALYRTLTLLALEDDLGNNPEALAHLARNLELQFKGGQVLSGSRDVTREIRSAQVTAHVSAVAAEPSVREGLMDLQRRLAREHLHGAVLEGRDIGTVVFPDAEVKVFLTASDEERARRRHNELVRAGRPESFEDVLHSIRQRDRYDAGRAVAPLRAAEDATILDTTGLELNEVVDRVVSVVDATGVIPASGRRA